MNHLTEEDLILHYYGEAEDGLSLEQHMEQCGECREQYAAVQRVLNTVDAFPIPARDEHYGAAVWQRIEGRLERRRRWWWKFPVTTWRAAWATAAVTALMVIAFAAGRFYPQPRTAGTVASDSQIRQRVLLVAVGDYLERSQMVLVELANAEGSKPLDFTSEQELARDLVSETRLYQQTATSTGSAEISGILDELERVLVDISRGPSKLSPGQVEEWRQRLDAAGIIFKIRVVNSNVRNREETVPPTPSRTL
jgi:hypothetical protein